jgi:hypothetical protein
LSATLVKVMASSIVMAIASVAIQHAMMGVARGSSLPAQLLRLGASIGGGIAALACTAKILRVDEFGDAMGAVQARVQKLLKR